MLSLLFAMSVSISPITPSEFIGPCPVVLKFNVTITSDKPVSGTYQLQTPVSAWTPEPFVLTAAGSKTFPRQIQAGGPYGLHSWFEAKIVASPTSSSRRALQLAHQHDVALRARVIVGQPRCRLGARLSFDSALHFVPIADLDFA